MMINLSPREFELSEKIVMGATKKEVAYQNNISVYTVETTIKNVYEKLGINKLSELVLWYCGIAFDIAQQIEERKKQVLAMVLILIFAFHGIHDTQFRVRRYRRANEIEQTIPIDYPTEA